MNKRILKYSKKGIVFLLILMMLVMPTASMAYSFYPTSNRKQSVTDIVNSRYTNIKKYKNFYNQMNAFTQGIDKNTSVADAKSSLIDKITELQKQYSDVPSVSTGASKLLNSVINSNATSSSDLISTILGTIKSSSGNSSLAIKSLTPSQVLTRNAETAGKLAGSKYNVKLSANIYFNSSKSSKWVLLVHGNTMNGQAITDALGDMYIKQGFNIIAPDLRGFGKSEGSVAMGYLESLDVWDWLTTLNSEECKSQYGYDVSEVIVHGVSLGGATTVQLSGLSVDGKTLKQQNVIGLVEDCGYASMTGIITGMLGIGNSSKTSSQSTMNEGLASKILGISDKTNLSGVISGDTLLKTVLTKLVDTGLTDSNFDELQNGLNSLKKCEVPLMIVHGTKDSTVPFENSDKIYQTAMENSNIPYVQRFTAEGEQHAFIILGSKYNVYEGHIDNFIKQAEAVKSGKTVNKVSDYKEVAEEKTSVITSLIKALKLLKNIIGI